MSHRRNRDWIAGALVLLATVGLFAVYASGQWDFTFWFVVEWLRS